MNNASIQNVTGEMTPSQLLVELIARPSVNPMGAEDGGQGLFEAPVSDWLADYFAALGCAYERIKVATHRANVLARFDSPGSQRTILLDVHQDTVPVEGMTIDPFQALEIEGKIFGRGAADVKGGMAAMLHAFTRLHQERPAGAANVVLCCSCDEEATTIGVNDLITYWSSRRGRSQLLQDPPEMAVVAEPTDLDVVVAHLGVLRFRVHTTGRACHSSVPSRGVNAIYKMAEIVARLEQIADDLSTSVPPHPLCGSPALSVGKINGGTSVNIVPAGCTIEIDRRLIPGEDPLQVYQQIRAEILQVQPAATCDMPSVISPALSDHQNGWLADQLVHSGSGLHMRMSKVGVAYCTHASAISGAGIPTVVFGPGSINQAHTVDEFIEVTQLNRAAELYYSFCASNG